MKKTVVIMAIALGFSFAPLNATNNVNTSSNFEVSARASLSPLCMAIVKGDLETAKSLIDKGIDVNRRSNGLTPAMYAAKYNRTAILKLLVEHGALLNKTSNKGMTAEKYAQASNAKEALEYIKSLNS